MKRIFLLFMFLGTSANAATMCAPDLSTCESCTDGTYDGGYWTAECCGVQVSGVAFDAPSEQLEDKQSQPLREFGLPGASDGRYIACLMLSPIVAKYYHMPVISNRWRTSAGQICMENFKPVCALVECNLPIEVENIWNEPA